MKQFIQISILSIFLFVGYLPSCQVQPKIDYIIYGVYCGECIGHCAVMYKLNRSCLLRDTTDSYFKNPESLTSFKGDTLSETKFKEALILIDSIPKFLFQTWDREFGHPDSYDQCGIYLQIKTPKGISNFHLDPVLKDIPPELRNYAKLLLHQCGSQPR